ncbi:hypothetical protein [Streptomyces fulvoviolaceus]|uniref:hypothetical protein n=1 Tax=Streptomyces fulvoviolaceus TaxID=285535 RepID=UPI0021C1470B|nr:hypothetical protein [Streptomyces fulvoviolaceus]MCT9080515.1 hypothetical protein [Streptomyces fulvoviolaceus]
MRRNAERLPTNDTDGGETGGDIRQAYLYNSARVGFTSRGSATATTAPARPRSSTPSWTLPASQQYTYVHDGNSQVLDHTLVSSSITSYDYDIAHINSEFSGQTSDHDPQVARITP